MGEAHKIIREIHHVGGDTPERLVSQATCAALERRGLWLLGMSDAGQGYEMARPSPPHAHLLASLGGEGRVWIDGQWHDCPPGTAYLTPPDRPMGFHPMAGRRWQFGWVYFAHVPQEPPVIVGEPRRVETDTQQLAWAIEGLHREATGVGEAELLDAWAGLVHAHAMRIIRPETVRDPLWRLWAEVEARLAEPWTVRRLADHAGREPEALRRLCLRHLGTSPMRHVTDLRMRRAQTLLVSTQGKLFAVARAVGYNNVFAFSTAFKRYTGHSPDAFRRSTRGPIDQLTHRRRRNG